MIDTQTLLRIIDTHGLGAAEAHVSRLVADARRDGIGTAAVDVLADQSQPEVARLRALARVQRDLSTRTIRTVVPAA